MIQGQSLFPGAQRETEAGDVLGLAARCSLWGGGTTRKGPSSPPRARPTALSLALAPDAGGFISLPTYF